MTSSTLTARAITTPPGPTTPPTPTPAQAVRRGTPPPGPGRTAERHVFRTFDGLDLVYRHWPAPRPAPTPRAVLLFHRGHEHGARMAHLVDELDLPDCDFFAWDARGHGESPGPRGFSPGFDASVRDVQAFVDHLERRHGFAPADLVVVAQSVGAALIATWVHDHAPPIRGMVLAAPAFKIKLYVPFARTGLKLLQALRGPFQVNSYVKARFLTHDPQRIASYEQDPLIARPISVNVLLGLLDAADRVVADAQAITVPTQLLVSGADWVVHHRPQHRFFERLGSAVKERHVLDGFFHDTLGERDRAPAIALVRAFLTRCLDTPAAPVDLRQAHRRGFTFDEAQALARPLPWWSPRAWYWALTRAGLRLGGHLSEGIRLGHQTGFDSGATLDAVYRNQPAGRSGIGKAIDRVYLQSIGWRGIRQRKVHLEASIQHAMACLQGAGQPVHVLDIAAGHGRYVLDAVQGLAPPRSITLRDYSEANVRSGQALIEARGLGPIARFVQADAFDRADLAANFPRPTLAVVSGLYELFADNDLVARSLAGLADAMPRGSWLVYTNQPWHPQLALIARALTSHRQGQAWVMRRRTQAEMDQLVAEAGFRKVSQRIDAWGIFTVSLAQRL
jgi:alpha-beta hydrolase superfamily lysophospholipase